MGAGGFGEENFEGVDSSRCSRCEAMVGDDFFLAWRLEGKGQGNSLTVLTYCSPWLLTFECGTNLKPGELSTLVFLLRVKCLSFDNVASFGSCAKTS